MDKLSKARSSAADRQSNLSKFNDNDLQTKEDSSRNEIYFEKYFPF